MRFHPITLGVKRTNWSKTTVTNPGVSDAELDSVRKKILSRDDFKCQCCGFIPYNNKNTSEVIKKPSNSESSSKAHEYKYQKILYLDGDERNVSDQNCLTTCTFCHQCFDLSQVEIYKSGMLIWLPEIGQAALHHVMRALYVARVTQGPLAAAAKDTIDQFYKRADDVRKRLGSSDPSALAMVLQDFLSNKQYEKATEQLRGIRLLPLDRRVIKKVDPEGKPYEENEFASMLAYWRLREGIFADFKATEWPVMIANEIRKVA